MVRVARALHREVEPASLAPARVSRAPPWLLWDGGPSSCAERRGAVLPPQELNNRLAAEISRLRTLLTGDTSGEAAGSPLAQGKDAYELEVLRAGPRAPVHRVSPVGGQGQPKLGDGERTGPQVARARPHGDESATRQWRAL